MLDKASDPNGNFGNMFSLWDQLFGTATFQTSYPEDYGLQRKSEDNWTAAYFYPFVTSKDEKSEWHKAFQHQQTATKDALSVELTKGKITSGVPVEEVKNSLFAMAHITELK